MSRSNQGYTLVELLIAIAIGAVILFGVTTTFVGSMKTSATSIRNAQFHEEMRSAMNVITRDLRRAGYSSKATDDIGSDSFNNDFLSTDGEDVRLWDVSNVEIPYTDTSTVGECVTFSFDAAPTPDGVLTADTSDYRGFKFQDNAVWKRTAAPSPGENCAMGDWSRLTTDAVVVDEISFKWVDYTSTTDVPTPTGQPTPEGCTGTPVGGDNTIIMQRTVLVTLRAHSANDPNLIGLLIDNVKVRNYAYNPCGV